MATGGARGGPHDAEGGSGPTLHLFDDGTARAFEPFSLTRPLGELLFGCLLQRERAERLAGVRCAGHLADPRLRGFSEGGAPPVLAPEDVSGDGLRILLSSRAVPGGSARETLREALEAGRAATLLTAGEVVGWILPGGEPAPSDEELVDPAPRGGEEVELGGSLLTTPWELVAENAERLAADVGLLHPRSDTYLPHGVERLGREVVSLAEGVEVEPGVLFDARSGPIHLASGVRVRGPARLEGPLFVGRDSVVLGGSVTACSIGPVCKVRGEIEESVLIGFSNKAHDGFLGHALLGRWVNLGANTTNSDLKNNYSSVRVTTSRGEVDTGLLKVGSFLGDHVKTGIGTLLNTGTVIGAGSNVFGGAMPPKHVPPFSWGAGSDLVEFRLEAFLETARAVMARRDVELGEGMEEVLRRAFEASREEREAAGVRG